MQEKLELLVKDVQERVETASGEELKRLVMDCTLLIAGEYVAKKAAAEKEPDNASLQLLRSSGYELLYDFQVMIDKHLGGYENG